MRRLLALMLVATSGLTLGCESNPSSKATPQHSASQVAGPHPSVSAGVPLVDPVPTALPHYNSAEFTPRWDVADDDASFHRIRPFELVNQSGKPFSDKELRGKITVASFFFTTCPAICVRLTASMRKLQEQYLDDDGITLISHSVTPEIDTPEILAKYATKHKIDVKRWKLLTGKKSEVYDLGRNYYFVEEDLGEKKADDDFLHTENFVLLDHQLRIRGIYNGLAPNSIKTLVEDIATLRRATR